MRDHIGPQLVAHGLRVPVGVGEEALHPLGARLAKTFGKLPTIFALHMIQQANQVAPHPFAHLPPVEIAPDARMHLIQRPHRSHRLQRLQRLLALPVLLSHLLTSPLLGKSSTSCQ